jgi:hypothetical protein
MLRADGQLAACWRGYLAGVPVKVSVASKERRHEGMPLMFVTRVLSPTLRRVGVGLAVAAMSLGPFVAGVAALQASMASSGHLGVDCVVSNGWQC